MDVECQNYPTDKQTRKAKRFFGEGFVWVCPICNGSYVLAQGKGNYWYWKRFV